MFFEIKIDFITYMYLSMFPRRGDGGGGDTPGLRPTEITSPGIWQNSLIWEGICIILAEIMCEF